MKKLLVTVLTLLLGASLALAGGDKNRGAKGQGTVKQVQVRAQK